MDGFDSLYWMHLVNAALGVGVVLAAGVVFTYFRNTSVSGSLKLLAAAFGVFVLHSLSSAYEMLVEVPVDELLRAHELMLTIFMVLMIAGLYQFRVAFKKFDWAKTGSA